MAEGRWHRPIRRRKKTGMSYCDGCLRHVEVDIIPEGWSGKYHVPQRMICGHCGWFLGFLDKEH